MSAVTTVLEPISADLDRADRVLAGNVCDSEGCGCGPNFAGIEQHPEFMTRVTFEDDEDNEFNLREFAQLLQQEAKKYAAP